MNFEEHVAKPLLAEAGIATPAGGLAVSPDQARDLAANLGPVVVKAQIPTGKRGKAGGVKTADTAAEAAVAAETILGMEIGGHRVERLLVEARVDVARELYAAVLDDASGGSPLAMFSTRGGMDIEAVAATAPDAIRRVRVDIARGFGEDQALALISGMGLESAEAPISPPPWQKFFPSLSVLTVPVAMWFGG